MPRRAMWSPAKILQRAVRSIEDSLRVLHLKPGDPLCLLGGLASLYMPLLPQPVRDLVKPPLQDALGGAVSMAARLFRSGEGADE